MPLETITPCVAAASNRWIQQGKKPPEQLSCFQRGQIPDNIGLHPCCTAHSSASLLYVYFYSGVQRLQTHPAATAHDYAKLMCLVV